MRIAYLTGRTWRGLRQEGLPSFEAPDHTLFAAAAAELGLTIEVRFWDDPAVAEAGYDAALVRSCWDYTADPEGFVAALDALEAAGVRVFNPPSAIRWNADKRYLEGLAAAGAPTIPTIFAQRLEPLLLARAFEGFNAAEIVAKPQVGAGGVRTIRLQRASWGEGDLALGPLGPVMLQPYLPAIETMGETSLFYFGGALSHVVRKLPPQGGWLANAMDARFEPSEATSAERAVADAVLAAAPPGLLYARVDLVQGGGGPLLIELEAIEPYLFLRYAPQGAANLARATKTALSLR